MRSGWQPIPLRASRRWGWCRMLVEAAIVDGDRPVQIVSADLAALCLQGRTDPTARVVVLVPDAAVEDQSFDLWRWVLPRANRAHRAGRLVAPAPRFWPPASAPPRRRVD